MAILDGNLEIGLPLTRRAALALGGLFAALTGLGGLDAEAKKRKRRRRKNKKRKKKRGSFFLEAPEMTGDKEVPSGSGDPNGQGSGECSIKGNEVCCTFQFTTEPDSPITGVHIHEGPPDEDGPIRVDFQGQLDTCVLADEGIAAKIKTNPSAFYANIHTEDFLDGAVRAQLQAKA
jgi:hypothetical protein